jgi:hypothetical protein
VKKSDNTTWEVEHPCPQCGAPVTLAETDRLFACSYCRVRLYLLSGDYFRYYLPPRSAHSKEILFAPYWRFKGLSFFCGGEGVTYRVNDLSYLASQHSFLPRSLGIRPQALKLRFLSPEITARFFPLQLPVKSVMETVERHLHSLDGPAAGGPVSHKAYLGETISLIYSPLFIQGTMFHDGILGKPVAPLPKEFVDDAFAAEELKGCEIKFIPTLCPHCGWDLSGERDSAALFCKNCESVWVASAGGLKPLDFGIVPSKEEGGLHLPFWKMKARVEGLKLQSFADLLRMANVSRLPKEEWKESAFYFWSPAFKAPPELFLRLSQGMTLSQPQGEYEKGLAGASLYPVTFPLGEAEESIKVTISNFAIHKKTLLPRLDGIRIHLDESLLIFLPFVPVGQELIESQTKFCIHKNALRLGRTL